MARCPYLDFESDSIFLSSPFDHYVCKLTGLKMDTDDVKVKYVCKCEYGYEFEKCPVYQDR